MTYVISTDLYHNKKKHNFEAYKESPKYIENQKRAQWFATHSCYHRIHTDTTIPIHSTNQHH